MTFSGKGSYEQNHIRNQELEAIAERVRVLNDEFRSGFTGGRVMLTMGIRALPAEMLQEVITQVRSFSAFTADNDPHREHDFGSIDVEDQQIFWKLDCYDKTLEYASPNPTDPDVTERVLTIMLASEY